MATSRKQRRSSPSLLNDASLISLHDEIIFVWLDTCETDYRGFREEFCGRNGFHPGHWFYFDDEVRCQQFIKEQIPEEKRIILVTSGRLGAMLIEEIHSCLQLDSVYIYCQNIPKYKPLLEFYSKIVDVFSDPKKIFVQMEKNLLKKKNAHFSSSSERKNSFLLPIEIPWNPWETNSCTKLLPKSREITIVVFQNDFIPFQIILSSANQLNQIDEMNKYSITVDVSPTKITIGSYVNSKAHLHVYTDQFHQNSHFQQIYWIYFSKETFEVIFGLGERRKTFQLLQTSLDFKYKELISNISHLHVRINHIWQNFQQIDHLQTKIRFALGTSPLIDPELIILRPSQIQSSTNLFHPGLSLNSLNEHCRSLYHSLIHLKFDDEDFPDFLSAIEWSCRNPQGFSHQKLLNKSKTTNFLRLQMERFLIEIYPPAHSTPIHHHDNTYGMFRVLHGSILIRLFRSLHIEPSIEFLLHKDQVTWMTPQFNQIHQMKNVELNSCSILVQSYFHQDNENHKESIHYLVNEDQTVKSIEPASDMSFADFKDQIKTEWDQHNLTKPKNSAVIEK